MKKDTMATGNVRIFELAKELGLSSKELIGLFERLGLEAKNQLSVVDPKIADLVRGVLLAPKKAGSKPAQPARPAPADDAAPAAEAVPAAEAAPVATAPSVEEAPARKPRP